MWCCHGPLGRFQFANGPSFRQASRRCLPPRTTKYTRACVIKGKTVGQLLLSTSGSRQKMERAILLSRKHYGARPFCRCRLAAVFLSILLTSVAANCRDVEPARYGAQSTGRVSSDLSSILCRAVVIRSGRRSYIF